MKVLAHQIIYDSRDSTFTFDRSSLQVLASSVETGTQIPAMTGFIQREFPEEIEFYIPDSVEDFESYARLMIKEKTGQTPISFRLKILC